MRIGVLALQGDFAEHEMMLHSLGADVAQVRLPQHLTDLDGLIIPGGESTTIGKLAEAYGLIEPLQRFGAQRAIWGTCAGAIFLSRDIHRQQPLLGLMDIVVSRNAFGRQVDSFEASMDAPFLTHAGEEARPFRAVFIRAPIIESVGAKASVLMHLPDNCIVAARQGKLLATSFHPELTGDTRFHRYFMELAR